jgi:NitT/TauT family transport system permease protein
MRVTLGRRLRGRAEVIWPPLMVFVVAMILWQILPPALGAHTYIVPTPIDVGRAIRENSGEFWQGVFTTSWTALVGFALSAVLGVIVACVMATWKPVERTLFPYMVILTTVPIIAVAPLIIVWFGFGSLSIVLIAVLIGFFPVVASTVVGLHSASTSSVDLFRIYRASTLQTLVKLRLWTALPFLLAALRVTATLAVVGTIVGEYVAGVGGSGGGLGYIIVVANSRLETSYVFAAAIASCVLGILFFWVVGWVSRRVLGSWHESALTRE